MLKCETTKKEKEITLAEMCKKEEEKSTPAEMIPIESVLAETCTTMFRWWRPACRAMFVTEMR